MKKVFLVGSAPLPQEKSGIREAAGLRTEQFLSPLQSAGYEIFLLAISSSLKKNKKDYASFLKEIQYPKKYKNTKIQWISRFSPHLKKTIREIIDSFSPDVVIGVNTFPAYIVSTVIPSHLPFWADLNGWIMAEAQARGWQEDTNTLFANAFRQQRKILLTADKISTVSEAQKFCTIGELSALGMIQKNNFREKKVFALPNCTKFFDIDQEKNAEKSEKLEKRQEKTESSLFRENPKYNLPPDAFVVAWIGGYNNWVDEKTLFSALEKAMSIHSNLFFVSTGGAIKNIANATFSSFLSRIDKSVYKHRFIFLGWIDTKDMKKIYYESDAGINSDFFCIETQTGARNRINEMLKFGLPVITTGGSEISNAVENYSAGIRVENEDPYALCDAIIQMIDLHKNQKGKYQAFQENGKMISTSIFSEEFIQKPVLEFVNHPTKNVLTPLSLSGVFLFFKNIYWYWRNNSREVVWSKLRQKIG